MIRGRLGLESGRASRFPFDALEISPAFSTFTRDGPSTCFHSAVGEDPEIGHRSKPAASGPTDDATVVKSPAEGAHF